MVTTMKVCIRTYSNGVVEWNSLRWFGHIEKMKHEECGKVYMSKTEGPNKRGRPLARWKDKVKEYMSERSTGNEGELEQVKRECLGREMWRLSCHGHPHEREFPEGARH